MAEKTHISWADATFNPWRGCTKVSPGCKNCYAETLSKRNPQTLGMWGPQGTRVMAAESYWKQPLKWDREAKESGKRLRVFCASLADVGERKDTCNPKAYGVVVEARLRLLELIHATPNLNWLLLTKRPESWLDCLGEAVQLGESRPGGAGWIAGKWMDGMPPGNIWMGTSVEDQKAADTRIPALLKIPAAIRFLSCEPLLGPVELGKAWEIYCREHWNGQGATLDSNWLGLLHECPNCESGLNEGDHGFLCPECGGECRVKTPNIDWVIAGGESGTEARPMHLEWVRSLRLQCKLAGVPFHFKQWGSWAPATWSSYWATPVEGCSDGLWAGGMAFGKQAIKIGTEEGVDGSAAVYVGKYRAGRLLDGEIHDALPEAR